MITIAQFARRKWILGLAVFLIAGVGLWFTFFKKSPQLTVSITFIGWETNSSTGARLASYKLINQSSYTLIRWGHYFPESPAQPFLPTGGVYAGAVVFEPGLGKHLKPGESEIIHISAGNSVAPWRPVFVLSLWDWHRKFNRWLCETEQTKGWDRYVPLRLFQSKTEFVRSDWLVD